MTAFTFSHFADFTVLHARVIHGDLQKVLIQAYQSQCVSQTVSQITLL